MGELVQVQGLDLLTEVLSVMHLRGEYLCRPTFTAPWGFAFPARDYAYFRFVEEGECWVVFEDGSAPIRLKRGDLLLLPHGHAHALCDQPGSPLAPLDDSLQARGSGYCADHTWGGGGQVSRMLGGAFHMEHPESHPLFRCMPTFIHLRADQAQTHPGLEAMLSLMAEEAKAALPGVQGVITRLLETIFIQTLRVWTSSLCGCGKEWMVALSDPHISSALDLIHRTPEQPWTVASLSERVGLSRSPFAARFSEKVGMPPLAYLTQWRMRLAARLLREQNLSLAQVSGRVGYASEAAFSRVFKQQFGVAPGSYRRRRIPEA